MKKLVVTGPNTADFITTEIPSINTNQILVKTICTAISTGTEIRVYKGISIDADNKFKAIPVIEESIKDITMKRHIRTLP